jgi:hypothetical protein
VVVLPSCGKALVTIITLADWPVRESRIEVRRARYASAICDFGCEAEAEAAAVRARRGARSSDRPGEEASGMTARDGSAVIILRLFQRVHSIVTGLEDKRERHSTGQTYQQRHHQITRNVRRRGRGWRQRRGPQSARCSSADQS